MLALTRRTEYALMAICHLARSSDEIVSAREIADEQGAQLPLLMNVMKTLTQAGIVASVRGSRGGYRLRLAPESMTLAKLIHAVEGPVRLVRCVDQHADGGNSDPCELESTCRIKQPVKRVHERFQRFLDSVTIAEIAFDCCGSNPESNKLHEIGITTHALHLSR